MRLMCLTLRPAQPQAVCQILASTLPTPGIGLAFRLAALALALHRLALVCMIALKALVRGPRSRMYTPALALHGLALVCMARMCTPALARNGLALVCMLDLVALVASLVGGPRTKWYSPALALALVCMCAIVISHAVVLAVGNRILPPRVPQMP